MILYLSVYSRRPSREHVCANTCVCISTVTLCCVGCRQHSYRRKMDQDEKEAPVNFKKLAETLEKVSVHLTETLKKVSNLTVLVHENVKEISRLK